MRKLLLLLLLAAPAGAAETSPAYWLGGRLSLYVPADGDEATWNPGVQLKYRHSERLGLELAGEYQRHLFPRTTVHSAVGQLSALVYFPLARLQPFVLAGAGVYASRVHGLNYRRNLGRLGPHVGAGLEVPLGENWTVDGSWRHVWLKDIETRDPNTGNLRSYQRSGEQLSFGVNYRFGAAGSGAL